MSKLNRRGFLKTGITGAAGIMTLSPVLTSEISSLQEKKTIFRTLGKTGITVPVISFGVMNADDSNLCKAAYENGITLFDTANGYQNGRNEEMLGNLLKTYPRKSFILATKVKPIGLDRDGQPTLQTTPENFLEKFNTSLKRLGLDYVDILYMHSVDNPNIIDHKPLVDLMKKLKKKGKTRFIGFSTHKNMPAVITAAASMNIWDVILTTYNFKIANIDEMNAAVKKASEAGIGIVAMKTLAGGYLDKERTKPINTTAALKWVLSNPNISTAIPGMTNFSQLDLNVKIMEDITFTEQEKKDILIASAESGLFCSGCDNCKHSCPFKLPVPELMRAYMYAYGYSNLSMAYSLLTDLGTGSNPCNSCETCKVKCSRNFSVKEKISDISRLVDVPADFLT
jgi:uncharacterized protein